MTIMTLLSRKLNHCKRVRRLVNGLIIFVRLNCKIVDSKTQIITKYIPAVMFDNRRNMSVS